MSYIDKYNKIRPFVKLKIPANKKNFTTAEKSLITRYYNKLEPMGYFNREQEGYILKDISRTKIKIRNAPKIRKTFVNVGTRVVDGKIITDTRSKITIKDGKIYVKRYGMGKSWRFSYNIKKDWTTDDFKKHILKRMGQSKLKDGQIFAIGAGIYEMRGTDNTRLDKLAEKILQIANRYKASNEALIENETDLDDIQEIKHYEDFMTEIVVYESREVLQSYRTMQKTRKKRTKRQQIRMK